MGLAASPIDVVNAALVRLGQPPISTFNTETSAALITEILYDRERRALLRKVPWNFARVWKSLAQLTTAPPTLSIGADADGPGAIQYNAAYALPADFIRLYRVSPYDSHWRIVGQAIFTDAVPPNVNVAALLGIQPANGNGSNIPSGTTTGGGTTIGIEYIAEVVDPNLWDDSFYDAFVARLTFIVSMGITGSDSIQQTAKTEYKEALADAASINGMENVPDTWNDPIVNTVRAGYSGIGLDQ